MPPSSLNAAAEANALANLFYACANAVDDFRLSAMPPPSPEASARLKDESHGLDNRAHYLTAEAIGLTLAEIAPDLVRIKQVTAKASEQLRRLQQAAAVINLATAVLNLGTALAAGNAGSISAATDAVAKLVGSG